MVYDQRATAPVWVYILRQPKAGYIIETLLEKAIDRCLPFYSATFSAWAVGAAFRYNA
jgi:hypothetical protein